MSASRFIMPARLSSRRLLLSKQARLSMTRRAVHTSRAQSVLNGARFSAAGLALVGTVALAAYLTQASEVSAAAAQPAPTSVSSVDSANAKGPATKVLSATELAAVRKDIANILDVENYDDGSYGPLFVRLAWHSSGSYSKSSGDGGSNGAAIRHSPEKDWGGNAGLQLAVKLLDPIKARHPYISYADLYTLSGVVAIEEMGGPVIPWRSGRLDYFDGKKSPSQDNRLPDASKSSPHLRDVFYRMGFNDQEIVALSGAHSIGRCHTSRSGFDGPWTRAPTTFSNQYFKLLLSEKWTERKWNGPRQFENSESGKDLMMLPSDIALIEDSTFKSWVQKYAQDEELFFKDFALAFAHLLELGVKFEPTGQISATQAKPASTSWFSSLWPASNKN